MVNTERLRKIIKESGLKYQWLAKSMGLSRYGLSMKIDNKSDFKSSEIVMLCKLLKITSIEERDEIFFANDVDLKSTI